MRRSLPDEWRLEAGHVLGSWRIIEPLGRGGMGEVYKADHVMIDDRQAAVKILQPHRALDDSFRARFFEEVAVHAKINNPNVVRLYDANVTDGVAWMALELLAGEPLDALLVEHGTLSLVDALRVVSEVADGVHAIHAIGALHRDLKPANVFVTKASEVKVLDLGTTKIVGGDVKRRRPSTEVGSVIGTFTYMAPEQLLGERVNYHCDIYSLGVLAYVVLTGHHPFEGEDGSMNMQGLAFRTATAEPIPIRRFVPTCPEDVWAFIGKLLEKDPDHRPSSMAHVASEARALRNRIMDAMGMDPMSGLVHLLAKKGAAAAPPLQVPALDSVTPPMGSDPGLSPPPSAEARDATTRETDMMTPGGTVRMQPVPEEVNAYADRRAAVVAAAGSSKPPSMKAQHGTIPMREAPPEVVAHPRSSPHPLRAKQDSSPGTSRALAMTSAPNASLEPRVRPVPKWMMLAVGLTVAFAAGAIAYRVRSDGEAESGNATAEEPNPPVKEPLPAPLQPPASPATASTSAPMPSASASAAPAASKHASAPPPRTTARAQPRPRATTRSPTPKPTFDVPFPALPND